MFEILFLKKRPGIERVLTLTLALGGLWVVFSKQTVIPLPENSGDWLALAGGAIFSAGLVRLELIKTDGVFPIRIKDDGIPKYSNEAILLASIKRYEYIKSMAAVPPKKPVSIINQKSLAL